jgi:hypothetical protein
MGQVVCITSQQIFEREAWLRCHRYGWPLAATGLPKRKAAFADSLKLGDLGSRDATPQLDVSIGMISGRQICKYMKRHGALRANQRQSIILYIGFCFSPPTFVPLRSVSRYGPTLIPSPSFLLVLCFTVNWR